MESVLIIYVVSDQVFTLVNGLCSCALSYYFNCILHTKVLTADIIYPSPLIPPGRRHTLDLAASALAGLASTEDFTKVRLRKTAGPDEKDEYRGTKSTMLIHIKGFNRSFCLLFIFI